MKWVLNITRFILAFFVPGFVFIFISTKLNFNAEPFTMIVVMISGLFAGEVLAMQRDEHYIWVVLSRSIKDKIVFAVSLIIFGVFSAVPKYLDIKSQWVSLLVALFGLLVMFVVIKLLGSEELNDALTKSKKKTDN